MKLKLILISTIVLSALSSLAFQSSPYARRIRPVASTPASCQENEIAYNMTSHSLLICTNAGFTALATGGSGSFAPSSATFITQTPNATLTNEQALSALATGILKNTTTTGVLSIAIAGTDYENVLTFDAPLSRATNTISCPTCALTSGNLSQFAATTSAQLFGIVSDESGSAGVLLRGNLASLAENDVLTWNGTDWINAVATGGSVGSGNVNMTLANAAVTGTTLNKLVKITGAPSTAIISATTDTDQVLGVCTAGCGTTGDATVAILGQVQCVFDGATTAGNFVVNSDATAGNCEDGGSSFPIDRAAIGRVLSTNVGAGTYTIELMTPDIAFQNAGNGKSKPGGSNTQIQYNDSSQFGGDSKLVFNETTGLVTITGASSTNGVTTDGSFTTTVAGTPKSQLVPTGVRVATGSNGINFSSTSNATGTIDLSIMRDSAGVMSINNGSAGAGTYRDLLVRKHFVDQTVTGAGTTGNQTINKGAGTVNFAAAATAITVTNSLATANSTIHAMTRTNDSTCSVKNVVPAAGSFVINMTAACTAETSVGFFLVN